MLAVLSPIIVFGIVIFVHELGHFLAAKSVGVYTPRFSIGFGPALWRRRRGETEYVLAAFPLGGYVRMASRHDEASAFLEGGSEEGTKRTEDDPNYDPNAMIPFGPKPVPENRWFESKPLWQRLYILVAGVTMNIILGFVVAIGLAAQLGRPVVETRVVGMVRPVGGQPLLNAIKPGDAIVRVNGQEASSWDAVTDLIAKSRDSVTIETNRASVSIPLVGAGAPRAVDIVGALDVELPPVFSEVVPGEPGAKAGLAAGDSVIAVGGESVRTWADMVVRVASAPGRALRMDIVREGKPQSITVTPREYDGTDQRTGERAKVGRIGVAPKVTTKRVDLSAAQAVAYGGRLTVYWGTSIIGTVRDLATRRVKLDQLGGPIAITRASVNAARAGLAEWLGLIGLLSINVAILNLLPIPILDGGQMLINIMESARKKPFTLQTREYILRGGLMFILLLFVLVMFNDTKALVSSFFQ
jgi:regulator of sigma E protease